MSDSEDLPQLSAETFAALQQFYQEQEEKEIIMSKLNSDQPEVQHFDEDWQLSQFWYDSATVDTLVKLALKTVGQKARIALISCPTLYKKMKQEASADCEIHVYEYDRRFASFGSDFILYDYKNPLNIPRDKANYYDLVIADPPFLSDECLTKTSVTMKYISKEKLILCTGAVMACTAKRLLDLNKSEKFEPHHTNNLGNEFWCYSNYDIDALL
ncbi:PREDICTED: protein-lysine N-methyltransferase N6AMT2 [Nicrophorus vespilloides]|uniref:Protein-lysine N-methyltransferase LOC108569319 n=1 Tax=Nicrophorus vespilloides TaxID=110193 RepID=A0ABM1NHL6_NICVS|nr:PREDICTED: protein-lysine N-methyltransferase N6AMT2 [Nicrophorus vespilloides]